MTPEYFKAGRTHRLPPLILHPFSDSGSPDKLVQSSRASLMLQGLLPNDEFSVEQLERIILEGRSCEIRMLYYVGRDVHRWIDQCVEVADREPELRGSGINARSFATLLVEDTPGAIRDKLARWGVQDYRSIFSRSVALNAIFSEVPHPETLALDFLRNYHCYTDRLFAAWRELQDWTRIREEDFHFDLFASSEYSRMLAQQWEANE